MIDPIKLPPFTPIPWFWDCCLTPCQVDQYQQQEIEDLQTRVKKLEEQNTAQLDNNSNP